MNESPVSPYAALLKILVELRPAFDGHSGIPQETRLLFRGLTALPGVQVIGLIQSSNLVIEPGTPPGADESAGDVQSSVIDRMSKVVVSLQQGPSANRFESWRKKGLLLCAPLAVLASRVGRPMVLGRFDPTHFRHFLWTGLFAKSLPDADLDSVTSCSFRVLRWPWSLLQLIGVVSARMGRAVYPRLDTRGIDAMLVETPYPARIDPKTRMIVRYHDAIPLFMPHTIKDRNLHRASHFGSLKRNTQDGAWFACVSDATRRDLLSVFPALESRSVTIPNMVSHHFFDEATSVDRVPEIIWSRKNRGGPADGGATISPQDFESDGLPYLLMVATIEPRKNHLTLLDAWEMLRTDDLPKLNLVLVGSFGWGHAPVLKRLTPWLHRGGLHLLEDVPVTDLRVLYRHAAATVCPSFAEGFDFPGVEAMRSGGVVVASDIPVHRDVFGAASEYFSPYSAADVARALRLVVGPGCATRRCELRDKGLLQSEQFTPERVMPQWKAFLDRVTA